jgi:hypothetical protein
LIKVEKMTITDEKGKVKKGENPLLYDEDL